MYSLSSRSQRRHPFAFFIAIGYGLKYFTLAVTPPGRDRRARSAYAREALVISGRHLAPGRYTLRGPQEPSGMSTFSAEPTPAPAQRQPMPHARRGRAPCDVTVMRPSAEPEALPPPRDGARSAARARECYRGSPAIGERVVCVVCSREDIGLILVVRIRQPRKYLYIG